MAGRHRRSRTPSRARGGRLTRVLGEAGLNMRTAAWLGGKMARVVRSDLRRQLMLVQRRLR